MNMYCSLQEHLICNANQGQKKKQKNRANTDVDLWTDCGLKKMFV